MEENNIFEQKSPLKTYLTLAMPVVISSVINLVYNIADTYFVARTQNTMLVAGVSLCAPIFTILMAFGNIFGQGGSSLISRLFGQQKTDETKAVCSFCFYLSLLTGIIIAALMLLLPSPLLLALGADESTIEYARPYYLTMAVGSPLIIANFIPLNLLRSEGLSKESMIGSISGIVVNVILDPIMISAMGLGSFGAALASVIGYVISDIYLVWILIRKSHILSVNPKLAHVTGNYVSQIFNVGFSAAVTNWMSSICLIITNHFLLTWGSEQIAAMGVAQKVSMIPMMVAVGMVFGSTPIIGYYYGGRQYTRLKEMLKLILKLVEGVTLLMSLLLILAAKPAILLFLQEESIVSAATLMLRFQVITMFLAAFVMLATVCFQAAGLGTDALIVSVLRQGVLFLIVIFIAVKLAGYMGVVTAQAITDIVTAVVVAYVFYKRFYQKLKGES